MISDRCRHSNKNKISLEISSSYFVLNTLNVDLGEIQSICDFLPLKPSLVEICYNLEMFRGASLEFRAVSSVIRWFICFFVVDRFEGVYERISSQRCQFLEKMIRDDWFQNLKFFTNEETRNWILFYISLSISFHSV